MNTFIKAWIDGKEVITDFNSMKIITDNNYHPFKTGDTLSSKDTGTNVSQGVSTKCYRCGGFKESSKSHLCSRCMDSITKVTPEQVEAEIDEALQSVSPVTNAPKEAVSTIDPYECKFGKLDIDTVEVFRVLPAYRIVSDERKSRVLFLLKSWAEGELRQLHHIHQKVKPDNLTPAQYKDWLYSELKEVDKLLVKEMDKTAGNLPNRETARNTIRNDGVDGRTPSSKVDDVADILVSMNKAFNSEEYCEGINKYNVRGVYKIWAKKILKAVYVF